MIRVAKPVEVTMEGVGVGGEEYDFWFMVKRPPYSLFERIRKEKPDDAEIQEYITAEVLGQHILEWKSTAFEDIDTGEMLECSPENLVQVLEVSADMYGVFQGALFKSHMENMRKNLKTSPAGTSTGDEDSAKDVKATSAPE